MKMENDDIQAELNLPKACRICLETQETDRMASIYELDDDGSGFQELLIKRIEICGGIQIVNDPQLPSRICRICYIFLKFVQKFRTICAKSNELLQGFLEQDEQEYSEDGCPEYLLDYSMEIGKLQERAPTLEECETFQNSEAETLSPIESAEQEKFHFVSSSKGEGSPVKAEVDAKINAEAYTEYFIEDVPLTTTEDYFVEEICNEGLAIGDTASEENSSQPEELPFNDESILPHPENELETNLENLEKPVEVRFRSGRKPAAKAEGPHFCDLCGNRYKKRTTLDAHRRRHDGTRDFECEICHKKFTYNFQVERHMRFHTGEKPYQCQYCDRRFVDRSTMGRHQKIHRNEREYPCDICGKSFTYFTVLKTHMTTHTGEKPYSCGICEKRFPRAHDLRQHLERLQHKNDPRTPHLINNIKPDNDW